MIQPSCWRTYALSGIVCTLLFGSVGCGGNNNTPTSGAVATTRSVIFELAWGERSRRIDTPNSVQSVRIRFIAAGTDGTTVSLVRDRPAGMAATTQTAMANEEIRTGSQEVAVEFYTDRGGNGTLVAIARSFVFINADGSGVDDIAVTDTVRTVALPPIAPLLIAEERDVTVTARDADGDILALSPGSAFLTVRGGGSSLEVTPEGRLRGKAGGDAALVASVDGVESDPTTALVRPDSTMPRFTINWGREAASSMRWHRRGHAS